MLYVFMYELYDYKIFCLYACMYVCMYAERNLCSHQTVFVCMLVINDCMYV